METDSLFYRLFSEKPKLLFELLREKAPRTTYTFGSHEIKQTSLRTDGILQPKSLSSPIVFSGKAVQMGLQAGSSVAEIAKRVNVPVKRIQEIATQHNAKSPRDAN